MYTPLRGLGDLLPAMPTLQTFTPYVRPTIAVPTATNTSSGLSRTQLAAKFQPTVKTFVGTPGGLVAKFTAAIPGACPGIQVVTTDKKLLGPLLRYLPGTETPQPMCACPEGTEPEAGTDNCIVPSWISKNWGLVAVGGVAVGLVAYMTLKK